MEINEYSIVALPTNESRDSFWSISRVSYSICPNVWNLSYFFVTKVLLIRYKYDIGTNTYDTSEKRRTPAWCDRYKFYSTYQLHFFNCNARVLWRSGKTGKNTEIVTPIVYRRHELLSSDHCPVSATFQLKVRNIHRGKSSNYPQQIKSIVAEKRARIYQELVKELDKKENECHPDAQVSTNNVVFTDVRYPFVLSVVAVALLTFC